MNAHILSKLFLCYISAEQHIIAYQKYDLLHTRLIVEKLKKCQCHNPALASARLEEAGGKTNDKDL